MTTLLITILPSLLIVAFFVKSDRFPEPTSQIIKIFMFGIFLCIPAFYINTALDEIYSNTNISEALIRSFLSAAPVEEVLKFTVLYSLVYKMKDFNEPIDGIVYGVSVSLGFATLENIYYVYVLSDYFDTTSQGLAILRSFSAIPAHGIFGATMGYFFMKYTFIKKENNLALCMIVPILLHGAYNYFASSFFIISLLIVIISWIILLKNFSRLKKSQKKKRREYEKKV
jgi:RsiW-degrading membrane proteinase PrsW (M82 family)